MIEESRRSGESVLTYFRKTTKKFINWHFLFFIGLILLFCFSFILNTLTLSLGSIKLDDQSLSPVIEELLNHYRQMKNGLLLCLVVVLFFFFIYQQRLNKPIIEQAVQDNNKRSLFVQRLLDNSFLFGAGLMVILLTILLFPTVYHRIVVAGHSLLASHSDKIPQLLERTLVEASSNHIVLRFTTMPQIFEHLLFFSPEKWTRILFKAFIESSALFFILLFSLNSLVSISHLLLLTQLKKAKFH